ncbi:hypothetical protein EJ08DRAFT_388621 [Tothia fuscella]|uniref:Uncharacterized protein n=1 Tax=Tothia fuscella TaxID=1048955 RepID=A0A9P4U3I8_9PEZI|nr:hypothetical protein EJ08DRAFT_388621 [Tothia fuscella]
MHTVRTGAGTAGSCVIIGILSYSLCSRKDCKYSFFQKLQKILLPIHKTYDTGPVLAPWPRRPFVLEIFSYHDQTLAHSHLPSSTGHEAPRTLPDGLDHAFVLSRKTRFTLHVLSRPSKAYIGFTL